MSGLLACCDLVREERAGHFDEGVGQARRRRPPAQRRRRPLPPGVPGWHRSPWLRTFPAETSCGCSRSPVAARRACSTIAPSAGGRRTVIVREPSSSCRQVIRPHHSQRARRRRGSRCGAHGRSAPAGSTVIGPASSARSASVVGVAIRVSARIFANDIRPAANSTESLGSVRSARATRTCSRAVPEVSWHVQESQAAHQGQIHSAQPRRSSKSPSRTRNRYVAAVRWPASSQI